MPKDQKDDRKKFPYSYYRLNSEKYKEITREVRESMSWKDRFLDAIHNLKEYLIGEKGEFPKQSDQYYAAKAQIYKVDIHPKYENIYARNNMSLKDRFLDAIHNVRGLKGDSPQLQEAKNHLPYHLRAPQQPNPLSASISNSSVLGQFQSDANQIRTSFSSSGESGLRTVTGLNVNKKSESKQRGL